jgi:tetraacyldisaccharide 4'-kinase
LRAARDIIRFVREYYLQVIHGQRRGVVPALLRGSLSALSVLYGLGVRLKNWSYRSGLRRSYHASIPVISVGNITTGGTGKTPMVEWLARQLARQNITVAILARGYGPTGRDGLDDEALPEELAAEGVSRVVGADRVAEARRLEASGRPDVILMDDGFQHLRLHRDLEILMIDAVEPFANRHLLPRGLLREPLGAARRADWIVLSRSDQVDPVERDRLEERIAELAPEARRVRARHRPLELRNLWNGRTHPPEWLEGKPVYAFCGIGNPTAFRRTLEMLDAQVVRFRGYPDHAAYSPRDLRQIDAEGQEFLAEVIVTTEKDAGKLDSDSFTVTPMALKVEMELLDGRAELLDAVRTLIPRRSQIPQL